MSSIRSWTPSIPVTAEAIVPQCGRIAGRIERGRVAAWICGPDAWARQTVGRPGFAILLIALLLQTVYFSGLIGSDDIHYFHVAEQMRTGVRAPQADLPAGHVYFSRWIVWQLIRAGTDLLPHSVTGMVLPFMISSLGVLIISIHLGRSLLPGPMGYVPAAILAITPLNVNLASTALPEPPATFLAWLGLAVLMDCLLREESRFARMRMWAGGFLIAMAYSAKETAAIFTPCLLLFVLLCRRRELWAWRRAAWLVCGTVCWLSLDAALFYHWTGDPFFRLHAVRRNLVETEAPHDIATWSAAIDYWSSYVQDLVLPSSPLSWAGPILLAGTVYALTKKSDEARLLLCLIAPTFLYLSVGSSDLRQYVVLPHHPRYLMVILPAMALCAGQLVHDLWIRRPAVRTALVIIAVPLIIRCSIDPRQWTRRISLAGTVEAARNLVAEYPELRRADRVLVSDYAFYRLSVLPYFDGCAPLEAVKDMPQSRQEWISKYAGAYVITTRMDRNGPLNPRQSYRTFKGEPLTSLMTALPVGRAEAALDRLDSLKAVLTGASQPRNPHTAVELWKIPDR